MAGTRRLRRFKVITYHGYTVLKLLGIACRMIMQHLARWTAALMAVTAVELNTFPLRRPPVIPPVILIPTVVLTAMVPEVVMLGLITIAGTGIRTSRVLHANAVVTLHRIVICLQLLYFWKSIPGR
jgi:hypothetical protein